MAQLQWFATPAGLAAMEVTASRPSKQKAAPSSKNLKYTRQGNPELRQLTGREEAFTELGDLTALYDGLATHVRQHVNPLSRELQVPTPAPRWEELFGDASLPLQVDVGCGSGRFVLIRAQRLAGTANVLGLEIREKLVQRAQAWADRLSLRNCRFIFTNATVSWKSMLQTYPGPIELVSMQFPDPHFKKKHHKRRHVQAQLVEEMGETMQPGARVFLQGDVPEAVRWMRDMFERHGSQHFKIAPECRGQQGLIRDEWETAGSTGDADDGEDGEEEEEAKPQEGTRTSASAGGASSPKPLSWSADSSAGWLPSNPLQVPTEREVYVGKVDAPVYRVMLLRA